MNLNLEPLDDAALTRSERFEMMIDALSHFLARSLLTETRACDLCLDDRDELREADLMLLDRLVEEELDAEAEVLAHLKLLMASGTLDRCAELLSGDRG